MSASPAAWTELRVLVPQGWEELVAELVGAPPATGVAFGRPSLAAPAVPAGSELVRAFFRELDDTPALRAGLVVSLALLAERAGAPELAALAPEFRAVPPEDWAESWRKRWKPFRLGRLAIVLPEERPALRATRAGEVRLALEPGGAFGSGRHATTRMLLRALSARIPPPATSAQAAQGDDERGPSRSEAHPRGPRVLDAGMGSGILSVAAVLLGGGEAVGFDLDADALRWADDLAAKNGLSARCRFLAGGCELLDEGRAAHASYDVVLANIYSDVIQAEAGRLARALAPEGWFAFSGCPADKVEPTRAAIRAAGLAIEEEPVRGRWHSFVGSHAS